MKKKKGKVVVERRVIQIPMCLTHEEAMHQYNKNSSIASHFDLKLGFFIRREDYLENIE